MVFHNSHKSCHLLLSGRRIVPPVTKQVLKRPGIGVARVREHHPFAVAWRVKAKITPEPSARLVIERDRDASHHDHQVKPVISCKGGYSGERERLTALNIADDKASIGL